LSNKPAARYIIWGGKGHGKVLAEVVHLSGARVAAFFDRDSSLHSPDPTVPLLFAQAGFDEWLAQCENPGEVSALAAIGGDRGRDRWEYLNMFRSRGLLTPSVMHPHAMISASAVVGDNCHILAGAVVAVDVEIGESSIVNTRASVDHECRIGRGVHIAPGATLCGCVEIGEFSMVGAGAVVLPNIRIGKNSVIAAGSVVTRDVGDGVVAMGAPAVVVRRNVYE
jgi:sugar O-acyltransferase (sialic acid O-acetyltransferase NeuD family)